MKTSYLQAGLKELFGPGNKNRQTKLYRVSDGKFSVLNMDLNNFDFDFELYFDESTSLPNRLLLRELFEQSLSLTIDETGQQSELLPVVVLGFTEPDLSGQNLKRGGFNSRREALLKQLGNRMMKKVWGIINVTRISSNRFVILLSPPEPTHSTFEMLQSIQEIIEETFNQGSISLNLIETAVVPKINMGIAFYPCDGTELVTLLSKAELAMLEARTIGRDFQIFTLDSLQIVDPMGIATPFAKLINIQSLTEQLKRGQKYLHPGETHYNLGSCSCEQEVELFFQPEFDPGTRQIYGLQVLKLARTKHRQECSLVAEEAKQVRNNTQNWVDLPCTTADLLTVSKDLKEWFCRKRVGKGVVLPKRLTVELSVAELEQPDIFMKALRLLDETGLKPHQLALEISEANLYLGGGIVSANLSRLKSLGVKLMLSRLEEGFTSLEYLAEHLDSVEFDFLKVNLHALPNELTLSGRSNKQELTKRFLTNIIELAHTSNLRVIINNVNNQKDITLLEGLGLECDQVQGDGLCPPLSATKIKRLLKSEEES